MTAFHAASFRSRFLGGVSLGRVSCELGLCALLVVSAAACSQRQDASQASSSQAVASAAASLNTGIAGDGSAAIRQESSRKGTTVATGEAEAEQVKPDERDFGGEKHPSAPQLSPIKEDSQHGASVLAAVASPLQGQVQEADLRSVLDANSPAMERCLREDTVLDVTMKVQPSGELSEVSVTKSQPDVPLARDCVASVLRKLRLGNVRGGEATVVSLKLKLRKGTL
jgi:hypothetical protein